MICLSVVCCSPPVVGFAFDRHAPFGMQTCSEEAMDTVPIVRPPSVTCGAQNTTNTTSQLQPVSIAMDESDGNGVIPSSGDSNAQQYKSGLFPSQLPGISFQTAYTSAPCHVISQQPFSAAVPVSVSSTGGCVPVPSVPVSVPCYTVRHLPPSQPLVQPQVYYRPADGFCITTSVQSTLDEPQYNSERS